MPSKVKGVDKLKLIDKNGKLFGKISIIDIGIVIMLLAAALFIVYKLDIFSPEQAPVNEGDKLKITFYQEEVYTFTAENVEIGDPASEQFQNISFGKVVDIKIDDSVSWGVEKDGKQVKSTRKGWLSVFITVEAKGIYGANGITIGGYTYHVGQYMILRAGTSVFYGRLYSAEKV